MTKITIEPCEVCGQRPADKLSLHLRDRRGRALRVCGLCEMAAAMAEEPPKESKRDK